MINQEPHCLMLHHFCMSDYDRSQGAITSTEFKDLLLFYKENFNLINASEWLCRALDNKLGVSDVALTFDDALLCQYEIARPVIEEFNLNAFFFVYSSVLEGNVELLEVYRKFRTEHFNDINDFYTNFFKTCMHSKYSQRIEVGLDKFKNSDYLKNYPIYTDEDRKFRYARDVIFQVEEYNEVMNMLIENKGVTIQDLSKSLWMSSSHVKELSQKGNIIGLHSYSHPTALSKLSYKQQFEEYKQNFDSLLSITGSQPITMSHPCNSYNEETLEILKKLGIKLGFRSNLEKLKYKRGDLEYPREDHANVMKVINRKMF
jgi:peptidoglycan/xylan/chitin deacetylase (PgdA/CDA1 family)